MADVRQKLIEWLEKSSRKYEMPRFVRDVLEERRQMKQEASELPARPTDDFSAIGTD